MIKPESFNLNSLSMKRGILNVFDGSTIQSDLIILRFSVLTRMNIKSATYS